MTDSIRLGRILGIPIGVNWSIIAVAALFTASLAVQGLPLYVPAATIQVRVAAATVGVLLFFASILAHELGHALVAQGHGVGVSGISLWLLGGVAKLDRQAPTPAAELHIAGAGPAASAVLALLFSSLAVISARTTDYRLATAILAWLGATNAALALFNLLPAAPLDGGRVLSATLWHRLGDAERARVISGRCGLVLGVLLALAGAVQVLMFGQLGGWITSLIGVFVFGAARSEIAAAAVRRRLARVTVAELAIRFPPPVPDGLTAAQLVQWAGAAGWDVAYPVVRWGPDPIGYVIPRSAGRLAPAEQSWTRVSAVMLPLDAVHQAEAADTADEVLTRWGDARDQIAVVHDTANPLVVGTITRGQLHPLLAAPDLWGRDRSEGTDQQAPVRLPVGSFSR